MWGPLRAVLALSLIAPPLVAVPLPGSARLLEVPSRDVPPSVRTLVVLPPSYDVQRPRRFPVLYFLHDGQGSETTLLDRGVAARLLSEMREGTLPETILVAPRGVGTWYVDSLDGHRRYARFLDEELPPFIDGTFRTVAGRRGRAAMGISMGGYGALHWGFSRPDELAAVGGLSPALQQLDWRVVRTMPFFLRPMITNVFGRSARRNVLRANDLYDILLSHPESAAGAPRVFVRCGSEDRYRLGEVSVFFGKFLTAVGVENEVIVERGDHSWSYWDRVLPPMVHALLARLET